MLRYGLIYGGIAGAITILVMVIGMMFATEPGAGTSSMLVGYLIMLLAMVMIFVGMRQYRDREQGGLISFWTALKLGALMALVAGVAYVICWEIYLGFTGSAFIDGYTAAAIDKLDGQGLPEAELQKKIDEINKMGEMYGNRLFRMPMTMLEILPVGLIVAAISAWIVQRKPSVV
ncbi:DUF4199 domain-containing protein [Parvularcula marina]|nr:DUF4199 domain-containing protein [Parvularcula marina]